MQWSNRVSKIVNTGVRCVYLVLLVVLVVFVISNFGSFTSWIHRTEKITIGGVFELHLKLVDLPSPNGARVARWATYHRTRERVSVHRVDFGKPEYLEIHANEDVDLSGGYIGDSSEMLWLGESEVALKHGQCVRIFTYVDGKSIEELPKGDGCVQPVVAVQADGSPTRDGMYKRHPGEGDRIIIFDRDRQPVLDMDFWWLPLGKSNAD